MKKITILLFLLSMYSYTLANQIDFVQEFTQVNFPTEENLKELNNNTDIFGNEWNKLINCKLFIKDYTIHVFNKLKKLFIHLTETNHTIINEELNKIYNSEKILQIKKEWNYYYNDKIGKLNLIESFINFTLLEITEKSIEDLERNTIITQKLLDQIKNEIDQYINNMLNLFLEDELISYIENENQPKLKKILKNYGETFIPLFRKNKKDKEKKEYINKIKEFMIKSLWKKYQYDCTNANYGW